MRRLVPDDTGAVDARAAYDLPDATPADRPFVRVNMITSVDGAIDVDGRSGPLGGKADRHVFGVLRSHADVIVVGAGTFRREQYGPVRFDGHTEDRRRARGQEPVPPIAVVTSSGELDWTAPFFTEARARPIVLTTTAVSEAAPEEARAVADVVAAGDGLDEGVAVDRALAALHARGARSVLVEGGPSLLGQFAEAGAIDELCLTLSPLLVGGHGRSLLGQVALSTPLPLRTIGVLEEDGFFFLRFAAAHPRPG